MDNIEIIKIKNEFILRNDNNMKIIRKNNIFCNKIKYFFPGFNSSSDNNAIIIPTIKPKKMVIMLRK